MVTKKAGCFLIRKESREVVVIYRKRQNDYSFPKGHVEEGETLKQTAVREVAEETKRIAFIIDEYEPFVEKYTTPNGEECACYMFFAVDKGSFKLWQFKKHLEIIWENNTWNIRKG